MAFLSPVPGQAYSVKYLNMVMQNIHKEFYVGGHSKGGNFAIYSAMKCRPEIQNRIKKIYCMDGPGFRSEILKECGYTKIADRVVKIIPKSSMVGMIFEKDIPYRTVESKSFGLAQHDPYNWLIKKREFVETEDIHERSRFMDDTVNAWIHSLNKQQLKLFVDTLFQLISAAQVEDLIAFTADRKRCIARMRNAWKELDEQTGKVLREIIKSLWEVVGLQVKEVLNASIATRKERKTRQSMTQTGLKQVPPMIE